MPNPTKTLSVEKLYKLLDMFMAEPRPLNSPVKSLGYQENLIIMEYLRFVSKHRNDV